GYVQTSLSNVIINSSGVTSQTLTLAQANLTFKVNLDTGTTGWIEGYSEDGNKNFYGEIGTDGYARILADAGTYSVSVAPNIPSKSKTGLRLTNFVVTGSTQQQEVNLQPANIFGTVSPSSKAKQAFVVLSKKINGYWNWFSSSRVDANGGFFHYGDNGEYRLELYCWGYSSCLRTFSNSFTIASDSKTVDISVATPNVT
ncbi:MAG: hypothetical protein ACKPKO_62095, partial [Candidatus Fonsibacter sp.]